MRFQAFPLTLALVCLPAFAQNTPTVGSGAPTVSIQQSFQRVFFRNGFNNLVLLPPLGNVKALGTTGLVQEFTDASNSANKYAIVKPNSNAPTLQNDADVDQIYPLVYAYYGTLGTTSAGYPTGDTFKCPPLTTYPGATCQYQYFDKPAAIFVYSAALPGGSANFNTVNPFYTKWQGLGGLQAAGPATSNATAITSPSGIAATLQTFDQAAIFNITSGNLSGRLVAVGPHMFATYSSSGGYTGFLGLPLNDEQMQANGHYLQSFEGGALDYDPSSGAATLKYPIYSIAISPSVNSITVNPGDTVTLGATPYDANGNPLLDRILAWTTSNSRVVTITTSGLTATVKAVGGGVATVTAGGEGKTSSPIAFTVAAICCAVGDGAPTSAIQQAFQDAVARNKLSLKLPAATPVSRLGTGYVQNFMDANTGSAVIVAIPDGSAVAYAVAGPILAQYQTLGGPAGPLGFPASDASPGGGHQLFANKAALAGNPVQLVSGSILAKWASLGYETGPAGSPVSAASSVLSFRATQGFMQAFSQGTILSANQGYFVSGLIASAYAQSGGPAGSLGFPTGDEATVSGKRHQDFEGGSVDYSPGDAAAQVHLSQRQPLVTATPSAVLPGTLVRLAAGGFDPGATVRISVSGQTDFTVTTPTGAYAWQVLVPANAKTGAVTIHAVDTGTSVAADGSYTIQTAAALQLKVVKAAGDGQTGVPGAALPQPIVILLTDSAGNPQVGAPVQFNASPGARIVSSTAVTDSTGRAQASVRLPASEGLALFTAGTGTQLVTFSAQISHASIPSFPKFAQSDPQWASQPLNGGSATIGQGGALLTAAAAILRFYQNSGALPSANGSADPAVLNRFLSGFCIGRVCDGYLGSVVNLWRLGAFTGGGVTVSIENPSLDGVHDILAQGMPVLLGLAVQSGSVYVVATGVNADGSIAILDPSGSYSNLNGYVSAQLTDVVRLIPQAAANTGFLVSGPATFQAISPVGPCPAFIDGSAVPFTIAYCDGAQNTYEIDLTGATSANLAFTDLGSSGARLDLAGAAGAAFAVSRQTTGWTAAPQTAAIATSGIVNAATFTSGLAPGGLLTIFGSGLAGAPGKTSVAIGGEPAAVVAQSAFQVSAAIPLDLAPGVYPLTITSAFGSATQTITIVPAAPAVFMAGTGAAVLNQDGTLNTPGSPAQRGRAIVIYCTGLGAVAPQGSLSPTALRVTALLSGVEIPAQFAGLAPGFVGLYQVNVILPASTPPGIGIPLVLQEGDVASNPVTIAIQ